MIKTQHTEKETLLKFDSGIKVFKIQPNSSSRVVDFKQLAGIMASGTGGF